MTPLERVRAFRAEFGLPIAARPGLPADLSVRALRLALLTEEFLEYHDAEAGDDLVGIADALADLLYVVYGTAVEYGIDLDAVFAEVHRSNMTKSRDPGQTYPSKCVVKGDGYSPPDLEPLLRRAA